LRGGLRVAVFMYVIRSGFGLKRKVISMAGQMVARQNDTVAIDKKMTPCYLKKSTQVKISENPLLFHRQGEILIHLFDERGDIYP